MIDKYDAAGYLVAAFLVLLNVGIVVVAIKAGAY